MVFFHQLFQKTTFWDKWHEFCMGLNQMPFLLPKSNSVKATSDLALSLLNPILDWWTNGQFLTLWLLSKVHVTITLHCFTPDKIQRAIKWSCVCVRVCVLHQNHALPPWELETCQPCKMRHFYCLTNSGWKIHLFTWCMSYKPTIQFRLWQPSQTCLIVIWHMKWTKSFKVNTPYT